MKKLTIIASLILVACVIVLSTGFTKTDKVNPPQATADFIIITYNPFSSQLKSQVSVHYGGDKVENIDLTKEEVKKTPSNYMVGLLAKFSGEGYELVSTVSSSPNTIVCFLRKPK